MVTMTLVFFFTVEGIFRKEEKTLERKEAALSLKKNV